MKSMKTPKSAVWIVASGPRRDPTLAVFRRARSHIHHTSTGRLQNAHAAGSSVAGSAGVTQGGGALHVVARATTPEKVQRLVVLRLELGEGPRTVAASRNTSVPAASSACRISIRPPPSMCATSLRAESSRMSAPAVAASPAGPSTGGDAARVAKVRRLERLRRVERLVGREVPRVAGAPLLLRDRAVAVGVDRGEGRRDLVGVDARLEEVLEQLVGVDMPLLSLSILGGLASLILRRRRSPHTRLS